MSTDSDTKNWIRNAADDRAARAGMVFDVERGQFVCDWIESYCCLYEGSQWAGEPMVLLPYQRDYLLRKYGWVRYSRDHGCWIRRFVQSALWVPKKNGKSPLAAAENLQLICADGEEGNKVAQGAADGEQATIAQSHAINMVLQSPALADVCKVHGSTHAITHLPTKSRLFILAGNDSRGAKTKEGLNGSVSFDEMHVVSREMYDRVLRAGRSRKEPLTSSYSTAGNDLDSIGYERWDYGRKVNSGAIDDLHFLHVEYGAKPGTTETEIDANFDRFAAEANPALGKLVKLSTLRDDWERAKHSSLQIVKELQYTFNLWVGSATRWLNLGGWANGQRESYLAALAGRECYAGLDLSKTRDMTAFVFVFPWPEEGPEVVRIWPLFWLPERRAKEVEHLVPEIKTWVKNGWLKLIPGSIVDYSVIKDDVRTFIATHKLKVMSLHYDETFANELTQALHEGETLDGHAVPGVVAQRVAFLQANSYYGPPASEFERRIIAGLVQHPGNGVMTWQVGHCEAKSDRNGCIRPVKPNKDGVKTIDGVVATVMAMAGLPIPKGEWSSSYFGAHIWCDQWPADVVRIVQSIDASKGPADKPTDYQAHVVVRMDSKGHFWVDAVFERESVPDMVKRSVALARANKPECIALEASAGALLLSPEYQRHASRRELLTRVDQVAVLEKLNRIRRLEVYLNRRQIHVMNSAGGRLLVQQLRDFPRGLNDDGPDALEIAIRRIELLIAGR